MSSSCAGLRAPLKTSAAPSARQSPQRSTRPAGTLATAVSHNWSGFQASGAAYSDIEAEWYVPKVTAPTGAAAGHSTYSSTWVGIGGPGNPGFPQYPLVQAGSESDWGSGGPSYFLWYQVPPEQGNQVPVFYGPSSSALGGTLAGVHITWGTHPSGCTSSVCASIHMWDTNSFQDFNSTYVVGGNWYNDDLAEWIYERTGIGGKYPYLADAPPNFSDAEVATGGNWYDAGVIPAESALDLEELVMETCNGSTVMAKPVKNGLSDGDIPMQFLSAGDNDVCG